ncbi:hypothetical protein HDV05_002778, partial [Chytridiales sp. JEL 0842]
MSCSSVPGDSPAGDAPTRLRRPSDDHDDQRDKDTKQDIQMDELPPNLQSVTGLLASMSSDVQHIVKETLRELKKARVELLQKTTMLEAAKESEKVLREELELERQERMKDQMKLKYVDQLGLLSDMTAKQVMDKLESEVIECSEELFSWRKPAYNLIKMCWEEVKKLKLPSTFPSENDDLHPTIRRVFNTIGYKLKAIYSTILRPTIPNPKAILDLAVTIPNLSSLRWADPIL